MGNTLIHFHKGPSDEIKDQIGIEAIAKFFKDKKGTNVSCDSILGDFIQPWMQVMPLRKKFHKEFSIDDFIDPFIQKMNITLSKEERIQMMIAFDCDYQKYLHTESDVHETLSYLKERYKLGVISNSPSFSEVNQDHFRHLGLNHYIEGYIFSYDLKIGKPRPEIFKRALELFSVIPDEALMVGDSLDNDILGAQSVGMKTAWLNFHDKPHGEICPDFVIKNLAMLKEIV